MEQVISLTDTAFLGRLNETALGASALGTVCYLIFFVLGNGFSYGAQILIARRNGEEKHKEIGKICYAGGFSLMVLALLLIALMIFCAPPVISRVISSTEIGCETVQYLKWRSAGLFFAFITAIFRAFFVGIARTAVLTISSVVMMFANIIFDYLLIFGKCGFPAMGVAGAALASSISSGLAMFCYIIYTFKFVDLKKYGFSGKLLFPEIGILKSVFSISFWMMLQPFMSVIVWFFFFLAVERLGERSLAVVNLARTLASVSFVFVQACGMAANSLTGNLIGAGRGEQIWRLTGKTMVCSLVIVLPLLFVFAVFPETVLRIYTDNSDLIADSIGVMYVTCVCGIIQLGATIMLYIVSGTGAVKMVAFAEMVALFFYALYVWQVIIVRRASPAAAWAAEIVYLVFLGISCLLYMISGRWRNKKI